MSVRNTFLLTMVSLFFPTAATSSELPSAHPSQGPPKSKGSVHRSGSPPVEQNLVYNGSFEGCPDFEGTWINIPSPSKNIYGWTVTSGEVAPHQIPWGNVLFGRRFVDLSGVAGHGILAQVITTEPGATYRVKFWLAGNVTNPPVLKRMFVRAAGQSAAWSFDIGGRTAQNLGWTEITWQFVAKDAKTTLEFGSMVDRFGPFLDNVSVVKIHSGPGVKLPKQNPSPNLPSVPPAQTTTSPAQNTPSSTTQTPAPGAAQGTTPTPTDEEDEDEDAPASTAAPGSSAPASSPPPVSR